MARTHHVGSTCLTPSHHGSLLSLFYLHIPRATLCACDFWSLRSLWNRMFFVLLLLRLRCQDVTSSLHVSFTRGQFITIGFCVCLKKLCQRRILLFILKNQKKKNIHFYFTKTVLIDFLS